MKKVLFICLGNSCRSQMAEAFAKALGQGKLEVYSAGLKPAGYIHPLAIEVMGEIGMDIRAQQSKPLDPELLVKMDVVVTLSPDVAAACPPIPPSIPVEHWTIEDAVRLFLRGEQRVQAFRVIRDQIEAQVRSLVAAVL